MAKPRLPQGQLIGNMGPASQVWEGQQVRVRDGFSSKQSSMNRHCIWAGGVIVGYTQERRAKERSM